MLRGRKRQPSTSPGTLALSEVVWSPSEGRDFGDFVERLDWHFDRFEALGVNYRPLDR